MKPSLIEVVQHYKKKIERNSDEQKILHCFDKLMLLPITLDILSETGVGKTVNAFRRDQGIVGCRSRELVSKWKRIFEESELARAPEPEESSASSDGSTCEEGGMQIDDSVRYQDVPNQCTETDESTSEYHSRNPDRQSSESRPKDRNDARIRSVSRSHHHEGSVDDPIVPEMYSASVSQHEESRSSNCSRVEVTNEPQENSSDRKKKRSKHLHGNPGQHSSSSGSVEDRENAASSSSTKRSHKETYSSDVPHSPKNSKKASSHGNTDDSSRKRHHKKHSRSEEHKGEKKRRRDSGRCESSREVLSPRGELASPSNADRSVNGRLESDGQGVSRTRMENGDTPSKRTVTNGSSFSDVLGGVDASIGKKKKKSKNSSDRKKSNASSSRDPGGNTTSQAPYSVERQVDVPVPSPVPVPDVGQLCSVPSAELPEISAVYRPLPRPVLSETRPVPSRRLVDEQEALSAVLAAKNKRTKVYSGSKVFSWTKVPTLVDICLRSLQENIDYLEYTGGVPFEILRPVLERCTAEQLHSIEYYNAYLTEDTAPLWEHFVKKEFRSARRQEYESWKEMYMRCCEEREAKLEKLRTTIEGKRQDHLANSRKTKVAFVNSVAKPPRNVARKQAKNGTAVTSASSAAPVVSRALRPAPGSDPTVRPAQNRSTAAPPKRKAPLMAKVLRSIGGRR